jgi:hypothetical protein
MALNIIYLIALVNINILDYLLLVKKVLSLFIKRISTIEIRKRIKIKL